METLDADNQKILKTIKEIRNVFDSIAIECNMASRLSMDAWARLLESSDTFPATCFASNILHKVKALDGLLYSIKKNAIDIKDNKCNEMECA